MLLDIYFFKFFLTIFSKFTFINNFFLKLSSIFYRSNHPSRLDFIKQSRLKLYKFYKTKKKIIFIGDSHVEYLSRFFLINDKLIKTKSIWIGPVTILGLIKKDNLKKFISTLKKNSNKNNIILLSLGSIDIRASFFELGLRNITKDKKDILRLFDEVTNNIFKISRSIIKTKNNLGFFEIFSDNKKGLMPRSIAEILKIRFKEKYPIFGKLEQRIKWVNQANKIIKKNCDKYNIQYLETNKFIKKLDNLKSFDGIHLSDQKTLIKINKNVKNKLNL